jgi:hypothetical protein
MIELLFTLPQIIKLELYLFMSIIRIRIIPMEGGDLTIQLIQI